MQIGGIKVVNQIVNKKKPFQNVKWFLNMIKRNFKIGNLILLHQIQQLQCQTF